MCEVIRHRGPDDEGIHVEPGVGLGMRRLSIIDLSGGRQPIHNETSTIWVVFNGEIYNYRELRAELEAHGHHFATSSDTETIVHAYEQWGEDVFRRLRGMFGIALWDQPNRTLLLGRDRAGQKPLHYAERRGRLYFASEIKSLLAAGAIDPALDFAALDHYLTFLYTPRDASIFEGVHKLPPGHYLRWRDGRVEVKQYWQIAERETFHGSEAEAIEALGAVLQDAVRSHMISDVPLGAFLSGGVDSSAVVGMMAHASSRPVKTFRSASTKPAFDELEHARTVARHFGTEHNELIVRPDGLSILDRLVGHFDEPFADSSAIPTWYVSEMARTARHRRAVRATAATSCSADTTAIFRIRGWRDSIACRCRGCARWRHGRGRCCRTACADATSCATRREATRAAMSIRWRCSSRDERAALYSATCARGCARSPRPRSRATSIASPRCRTTAG
jgi:asparagine synthase (glutamine-hydrolysing)